MAELVVPKVDFSPLGDLGNIYKEARKERGLQDAFSQGIGSDPQSLAALAQRVAPHNPQLAINLAQLAHGYTRQATQDTRQQSVDTFNQNMRQQELELRRNADVRAAKAAEEPNDLERRATEGGLVKGTPEYQQYMLRGGRNTDVTPSAGEKKEIFKAEDELPNIDGTIDVLRQAQDLNNKTFTGVTAGARGMIGTSGIPDGNPRVRPVDVG
jgi:hypothetical protein